MIFKDYYKILGLESNKATLNEIKIAYREKAKKYHPDMNFGNDEPQLEEIFKDINEAYRTLSNEKLRRKYDFSWNKYIGKRIQRTQKQEKRKIKDILIDMFLGGITRRKIEKQMTPEYGENVNTKIEISIEEAFFGVTKKLKFRTVEGKEVAFNLKIPAGIQNGDKLKIPGQGKAGKNGGKNGDLIVTINIKDNDKLKLIGTDLFLEIQLKTWEAALGTRKTLEILNEKISIIIPKCVNSDDKIIIEEKGFKDGKGNRGNLYVKIKIILPKELNQEEEKIYTKLKKIEENYLM